MEDFSHLLNWNLLHGSHDFPGPDGGTCINEAAIVASGFAYQKVRHVKDLPACFCPVISELSVWLNDTINDRAMRNRLLLPFVTRLAGTRGSPEDERTRLELLRAHLGRILAAKHHGRRFTHRHQEHLLLGDMVGPWTVRRFSLRSARTARELIRVAEFAASGLSTTQRAQFLGAMAAALAAMLEAGPTASASDADLVLARMEEIKATARARAVVV